MNKGNPTHQIGTMGPLTFSATCTADGANTKAVIGVTTSESGTFVSDSPDNLPGVSGSINAGDPPFAIVSQDTATANDGNSGGFAAFTPSGSVTVFDTAQTIGVAINTSAADCRFFGFLVNDA